ncbi:transposase family protein [Streptomyces sp. NPDC006285]|uniref:transposase family protein n=1 Tax=Streptomyces sp. NPDC006285 TaxID=3364742 RepID=UPI0036BA9500
MQVIGLRPKIHVSTDGSGVVGHAGARLLADLADATGLSAAYSAALRPLRPRGTGHDPGRIATDLAVMLDGTLAECDRVGDGRADYSAKHRRHGVNVQVVTDPGRSAAVAVTRTAGPSSRPDRCPHPPDRPHLRASGRPILADLAYQGGGPWVSTGIKRRPLQELTLTEKTLNRALSAARAPVERGVARLKSWRIFRRSRCSLNRMTSSMKGRGRSSAVLVRVLPAARWDEGVLGWGTGCSRSPVCAVGPPAGGLLSGCALHQCDAKVAALRLPVIHPPRPRHAWCVGRHGVVRHTAGGINQSRGLAAVRGPDVIAIARQSWVRMLLTPGPGGSGSGPRRRAARSRPG